MVTQPTLEPLVRKLRLRSHIDDVHEAALLGLPLTIRERHSGQYLIREGDVADRCCVLLDGFAFRQKILGDGGRQIIALQMPGDMVDLQNSLLQVADHSVQSLTTVVAADIPRAAILEVTTAYPAIAKAFWIETLIDGAIAWEWLANIGRRDARERLAHFLCEFELRLEEFGNHVAEGFTLPMTQEQLGDLVGLSSVHVNRSLKELEKERLIAREKQRYKILDQRSLRNLAGFSPTYLHLDLLSGTVPYA